MNTKFPFFTTVTMSDAKIAFNCPSEYIKHHQPFNPKELWVPDIIVVGDTATHQNVPLMAPEFVAIAKMFFAGGYSFASNSMTKPLILVGEKRRLHDHLHALRVSLLGLTEKEFKDLGVDEETRKILLAEANAFALGVKDAQGKHVAHPIDEFIKLVPFEEYGPASGYACFPEYGVLINHNGKDAYVVTSVLGDCSQYVNLNNMKIDAVPTWNIPTLEDIATPHAFRVFNFGNDNGFGPNATTGFIIETAGNLHLVDCPSFTADILIANGVMPSRVKSITLTHVHGDHADGILPFALSVERKLDLYATKEVFQSFKIKMKALWNWSMKQIERSFNWVAISDKQSNYIDGYRFDYHYCIHPIPTIGVSVYLPQSHNFAFSVASRKHLRMPTPAHHLVTILGDTALRANGQKFVDAGVIPDSRLTKLEQLLEKATFAFIDAGDAMIHGKFEDVLKFKNLKNFFLYHFTNLPAQFAEACKKVVAGKAYCSRKVEYMNHDALLLSQSLERLGMNNASVVTQTICAHMKIVQVSKDEVVILKGSKDLDFAYLIAHGIVHVETDDGVVTLSQGDLFGHEAIIASDKARNANVRTVSDARLIAIPTKLLSQLIAGDREHAKNFGKPTNSMHYTLNQIAQVRTGLRKVKEFRELSLATLYDIAKIVTVETFAPGTVLITKGTNLTDAYVIASGSIEIFLDAKAAPIVINSPTIVGEMVAIGLATERTATVRAASPVVAYRIPGHFMHHLYRDVPSITHGIDERIASYEKVA